LLFVASIAAAVAGCAAIDPVDTRYDTISRSLAKARNEAILLNLVRASHDHPLSFVTIANVTPSMGNTTNLGLPQFMFGPASFGMLTPIGPWRDVIFDNSTVSNSTSVSTNFNVSTQETSAFYQGFLKPIDLQALDYFIRQGYSRELLFWLFTDAVEVSSHGHAFGTRYAPPDDYGCPRNDRLRRCFRQFVLVAVAAGLTVEEKSIVKPGVAKPTTEIFARFCFSPVLADRARSALGEERWREITKTYFDVPIDLYSPKCGSAWDPEKQAQKPQPDTFNFQVGQLDFRIVPRSAYGVFEFIGVLIKMQRDHPPLSPNTYIPPERLAEELAPPFLHSSQEGDDRDLIRVMREAGEPCFVHTRFFDGDYCVPEDATNTKRVFSLLAQLIAITTTATDLSITPLVRVIQ
jgi:hypothetical protein